MRMPEGVIQLTVEDKKKQIQHLWKTVFDDSDEFIHFYFNQVYKDENAFVIQKGGQVVSALQILPYTMTYCGEDIPVAYISGAGTLPSEQGKGLMGKLLQDAFGEMKKRKTAVSALIPAGRELFHYYHAHGYTEIFNYSQNTYIRNERLLPEPEAIFVLPIEKPDRLIHAYFERKLRERPLGILHPYDGFAIILDELKLSGGQVFAAFYPGGQPAGMAFAASPGETGARAEACVLIKEILYENEQVKERLLYEITRHYNLGKALYRTPAAPGRPACPYGMARVIDAGRLIRLRAAAHPESSLPEGDTGTMDIHALTRHLLACPGRAAYMSLMLD